ncbi:MAG: hypothetical protein ACR2OZ_20485 [Verrucomicrobiales bacterium]
MELEPHHGPGKEAVSREPTFSDVAQLAGELNRLGAQYLVVGGFAIIKHGYPRLTVDIDLLIDASLENEATVLQALSILPDKVACQVTPGDVERSGVVRIGDEVTVGLMKSACGVFYADAIRDARVLDTNGVWVPYASPATLWRMKQTIREKDVPDRAFLRRLLAEEGTHCGAADPSLFSHVGRKTPSMAAAEFAAMII